jgi:hypothetical protein
MADSGTISRIGGILKTTFGPKVEEQQNKMAVSRKRYGKASDYWRAPGSYFIFPARVAGARGAVAPTASDDPLPASQEQNEQQFNVFDRGYSGRIRFYEKDIENASKNFQTFIPLMEDRMTNIVQDVEKIINIDFFQDGSGILGLVTSTVTAANSVPLQIGTSFGQYGSRYLMDSGDVVDFYDSTLTTSRTGGAGVAVTAVTRSVTAPSITVSANVTLSANDVMVRGAGRVNKSYVGIYTMTDDSSTTFQNLSRATYPILKGNHIAAGGQALSIGILQQLEDGITTASGIEPDELLSGKAQTQAYRNLSYAQKRYMSTSVDAGFTKLEFNGKEWIEDVDGPSQFLFMLNKDTIKFGDVSSLNFMDRDGDVLKPVPGFMAYDAIPREFGNFCYTRPNANGRIDQLAYASLSPYAK